MRRIAPQLLTVACFLVILALPLAAEVIVDDHFQGNVLDSNKWTWGGTYYPGPITVSGSSVHLGPRSGMYSRVNPPLGGNYQNAYGYGVTFDNLTSDSIFYFGFFQAIGGEVDLQITNGGHTTLRLRWLQAPYPDPLHTTFGDESIDLGLSSEGDFAIIWTPNVLQVLNNGGVLFNRDDPNRIPYYYAMGPFGMGVWEGSASVDRVVVTTPEPATISLIALGAFLLCHSRNRRRQ